MIMKSTTRISKKRICVLLMLMLTGVTVMSFASGLRDIDFSPEFMALREENRKVLEDIFLYQNFTEGNTRIAELMRQDRSKLTENEKNEFSSLLEQTFGVRLESLIAAAGKLSDPFERDYLSGLFFYDRYKIAFEIVNDRKTALYWLDKANERVGAAVKSNVHYADVYRLYGEIQNQYITLKGGYSAIYYSTEARKYFLRALKIDPKHAHSLLLLGIWNIFAPDIAGGSLEKALTYIRLAREHSSENYITFLSNVWVSITYVKALRRDDAMAAIDSAVRMAPNNTWAAWLKSEIAAGRNPLDRMM